MANFLDWLDAVQRKFSLANFERGIDSAESFATDKFGQLGGAVVRGGTLLPKVGLTAFRKAGEGIATPFAYLGANLSEAGLERMRGERGAFNTNDALLEGMKAGGQGLMENVTALDIASLGVGAGANMSLKAASAANAAGKLAKGASLARGAAQLAKADMALSAVDSVLGANDVYQGVKDGNWSRAIMGTIRVGGNTYGASMARKDLGAARAIAQQSEFLTDAVRMLDGGPTIGRSGTEKPPNMSDAEWTEVQAARRNEHLDAELKGLDTPTINDRVSAALKDRAQQSELEKIGFRSTKSQDLYYNLVSSDAPMDRLVKAFAMLSGPEQLDVITKLRDPDQLRFLGEPVAVRGKRTKSANADVLREVLKEQMRDKGADEFARLRAEQFEAQVQPIVAKNLHNEAVQRQQMRLEQERAMVQEGDMSTDLKSALAAILEKRSTERGPVQPSSQAEASQAGRLGGIKVGDETDFAVNSTGMPSTKRMKAIAVRKDRSGRTYLVEGTRIHLSGDLDTRAKLQMDRIKDDPDVADGYDDAAQLMRLVDESAYDEALAHMMKIYEGSVGVPGGMTHQKALKILGRDRPGVQKTPVASPLEQAQAQTYLDAYEAGMRKLLEEHGLFRSFVEGKGIAGGWTWKGAGGADLTEGLGGGYSLRTGASTRTKTNTGTPDYNMNVGTHAQWNSEMLRWIDTVPESVFEKFKEWHSMDPQLIEYATLVRNGGPRDLQLEFTLKARMLMRDLVYVAWHEGTGHTFYKSDHDAIKDPTKETYWVPGGYPQRQLVDNPADTFDALHTQFWKRFMEDESFMAPIKASLGIDAKAVEAYRQTGVFPIHNLFTDMRARRILHAFDPDADPNAIFRAVDIKHKGAIDRIVNRRAQKEAEKALNQGGGATPPGKPPDPEGPTSAPPDPIKPLSDRIEAAFKSQQSINKTNAQKNREHWRIKAAVIDQINADRAAGKITLDEYYTRIRDAESGTHGLIKEAQKIEGITPEEIDGIGQVLFGEAQRNNLGAFQTANLQVSWKKLINGERLEPQEVINLREYLGMREEAVKAQLTSLQKVLKAGEKLIGGSRGIMSSWDLSAAGRQALFASVMNPREAKAAFIDQLRALRMTDKEFRAYMDKLTDPTFNPYADLYEAAGLEISKPAGGWEGHGPEEAFANADWAKKVPGVRRSEQAYMVYLNKLRAELFNKGFKQLRASGVDVIGPDGELSQVVKDWAYAVNTLTGRGELSFVHVSPEAKFLGKHTGGKTFAPGKETMNKMSRALTSVFFAPKFAASRGAIMRDATMAFVGGNLHPDAYKMYAKNIFGTIGVISSAAAAVASMGVGTFETDWRKSDFGTLKVGKVRYDAYGGLRQWAKLYAALTTEKQHSKRLGWVKEGEYGYRSKAESLGRFMAGKTSPPAQILWNAVTGEDVSGFKQSRLESVYEHFTPMILSTITDIIKEDEAEQLTVAVPLAALGMNVNAYK